MVVGRDVEVFVQGLPRRRQVDVLQVVLVAGTARGSLTAAARRRRRRGGGCGAGRRRGHGLAGQWLGGGGAGGGVGGLAQGRERQH